MSDSLCFWLGLAQNVKPRGPQLLFIFFLPNGDVLGVLF